MAIHSYKELIAWRKAIEFVEAIYLCSKSFPSSEIYGLTSQLRRAAVSIPSNIAEGYGRKSQKEYEQFLYIAYGSALEVETQLVIAMRLGYIPAERYEEMNALLQEVIKMLFVMKNKIVKKSIF